MAGDLRFFILGAIFFTLPVRSAFQDAKTGKQYVPRISIAPKEPEAQLQARCPTIDLSKTLGPVRDQRDLSWCYAYTAADLMSQALRQDSKKVLGVGNEWKPQSDVSALQMAHEYQRKYGGVLNRSQDKGGLVNETLKAAMERSKICTEGELSSSAESLNQIRSARSTRFNPGNLDMIQWDKRAAEDLIAKKCQHATEPMRLVTVASEERFKEPTVDPAIDQRMKRAIDYSLKNGRIAGISYYNFLQPTKTKHGRHGSSVVGRKVIDGECRYQIRNSWGRSCDAYAGEFKMNCKDGHIWVTEDQLMKNVFTVDYVAPGTTPPTGIGPSGVTPDATDGKR